MKKSNTYIIITPVYNDWDCLRYLYEDLEGFFGSTNNDFSLLAIDDGSIEEPSISKLEKLEIIRLNRNLGHQRAIAIGLCYLVNHERFEAYKGVIVMDSDGEDQPSELGQMLKKFEDTNKIVFAKRKKRTESRIFRILYFFYKILFFALTKEKIDFGNFSVIPKDIATKLVLHSELWNHFSGAIVRSKLAYTSVPTDRGLRYHGSSKMNLTSLIIHGISSISIFLDVVAVRLLIISTCSILLGLLGIFIVVAIRYSVDWYLPGWATYTTLGLLSFIFLLFLISLFMILLVLFFRSNTMFIPIENYKSFIK